ERQVAAAAHVAPFDPADRAFEIDVELRSEVVLEQAADRPRGRLRPPVGERVEVGVRRIPRLAVAVDLAVLAPHHVRQTRVPERALGVGAGEQDVVACAPRRQQELPAGVDAPADLLLLAVAGSQAGKAAAEIEARAADAREIVVPDGAHVDVMDDAGHLSLAPTLGDVNVADEVGPALPAVEDARGIVVADRALVASDISVVREAILRAVAGGAILSLYARALGR